MKQKTFFLISKVLISRHTKHTSKNLENTTFKQCNEGGGGIFFKKGQRGGGGWNFPVLRKGENLVIKKLTEF